MGKNTLLLVVAIALVALALRLVGLGSFMTVDEENWIVRSSQYYENLFDKGDTGGAFMTTHPGATGMWLIGAGVRVQEWRTGLKADESTIRHFRWAATLPVALATALLIGVVTWLMVGLFGTWPGATAGFLLAADPYVTGMSQIAHLDALLALFMLAAVLFWLQGIKRMTAFQEHKYRQWVWIFSGVLAGLATATKALPTVWLYLFFASSLLWLIVRHGMRWQLALARFGFVIGVAALTFYVVWPALWTTPDLTRSFTRDYGQVVTDAHVEIEQSEEPIEPATFYVRTVFGRLTPLSLVLAAAVAVAGIRFAWQKKDISWPGWLLLYGIGYAVMITFAAKKGDRYALPALVSFIALSGVALGASLLLVRRRWGWPRVWVRGLAVAVGLTVLVQYGSWAPHAIAYSNPLFPHVRPRPQQGWGEGLEMAAAYLNESPFIDKLTVASWYPSVLAPYFEGRTMSLSSREDHRVGYVVIYRNMEGRAEDDIASNVLDEYLKREPEKIFSIQGVPYVWVYNTLGPWYFRQHVGEITRGVEVGQLVPIVRNGWRRLDLAIATFSSRNNTEDVIVHIREDVNATEDLRTVRVNARDIVDEEWQAFDFEPIPDSAGKTYYVAVTSPTSYEGNAVTVRYVEDDVLPGQAVIRRHPLPSGKQQSDFIREGDLGYRLFFAE